MRAETEFWAADTGIAGLRRRNALL